MEEELRAKRKRISVLEKEHFKKSVQMRSFFLSKYRKIRIRKNSVFGHFSRSATQRELEKNYKEPFLFRFFLYICSLFLVAIDQSILHHDNIQKWKLKNILEISLKKVINDSHDPNKVTFNFSSYELSDVEKSELCKGLSFSVKRAVRICV